MVELESYYADVHLRRMSRGEKFATFSDICMILVLYSPLRYKVPIIHYSFANFDLEHVSSIANRDVTPNKCSVRSSKFQLYQIHHIQFR